MKFQKDKEVSEGEEAQEVCTNYRYARRKEQPKGQGRREVKRATEESAEAPAKKAKKAAPSTKGGKKGAKGAPAPKEDEEKPAELIEAEKKQ